MRSERRVLVHALASVFFCISFATGTIRAQVTASVSGRVEDSTGATIPGASVTVTSLETGAGRTATTNETGAYRVLSLPVGRYEVRAELSGFKAARQTGISLAVGEEAVVNLSQIRPPAEARRILERYLMFNPVSQKARSLLAALGPAGPPK